jgi:hypothetical protein
MLVKIHANIRVYVPGENELTINGQVKKPFLGLRGPGDINVTIYGGTAGVEGLEKLVKELKSHAPKTGYGYVQVTGVRRSDSGFIGFAGDVTCTGSPTNKMLEWAEGLDLVALQRDVEEELNGRSSRARTWAQKNTNAQPRKDDDNGTAMPF